MNFWPTQKNKSGQIVIDVYTTRALPSTAYCSKNKSVNPKPLRNTPLKFEF